MLDQTSDAQFFDASELRLSSWMRRYREEMSIMVEVGAVDWRVLAGAFANAGYRDDFGMMLTPETAQLLWITVTSENSGPLED